MTKIFPIYLAHPEKICRGYDQYCPEKNMICGSDRTQHPFETYGKKMANLIWIRLKFHKTKW